MSPEATPVLSSHSPIPLLFHDPFFFLFFDNLFTRKMSEVAWFDGVGLRFLVKTAKDQIARGGEKWNLGNRLVTRGETHVASRVAALRHLQTFSFSTAILIFPLLDIFLIQWRLHTVRVHKHVESRQGLVRSFLLSVLSHRYIWRFHAFLVGGCSVFFFL